MVDLSIVIPSYNIKPYILACLASVYRGAPGLSLEVVVVDNASHDGSVAAIQEAFPQVRLILNERNIGFAGACNRGIRAASGRYILLLNADTEVVGSALAELARFADLHSEAAAFTCRLLNGDGTLQHSCFRFPSLRMAFFGFFPLVAMDSVANGRYPARQYDQSFEPEHALGACLMFRRASLEALGGLDDGYFFYFEETDLCYRLGKAGQHILYTPTCSVIHHGGRAAAAIPEQMSRAFFRSQARFYRKHYGPARLLALKVIVFFGVLFWAARSLKGFLRRRIAWSLLRTRLAGYVQILLA